MNDFDTANMFSEQFYNNYTPLSKVLNRPKLIFKNKLMIMFVMALIYYNKKVYNILYKS